MFWKGMAAFTVALALMPGSLWSQDQPLAPDVEQLEATPVFTITTVARTTQAVNYRYRRGDTKVDFAGTSMAPLTRGEAKVQAKRGAVVVEAQISGLKPANEFGAEYLTYVLWAVSPQGRAVNLGEVIIDGYGRAKLNATTELQTFGMVITAEPYFAVRRPSDFIVAENEIREDTKGEVQPVDAKYELLRRGEYAKLSNPLALTLDLDRNPIDLYQARNAVQIARSLQADTYAEETFGKAVDSLDRAEDLAKRRRGKKDIATLARQAVQIAEDARELAERRVAEERVANERLASAEREANAKALAAEEASLRAEAEAQRAEEAALRQQATQAKTVAEREKLEAELAAAQARAEMERALREKERAERLIAQARVEAATARQQQQIAEASIAEMAAERERLALAKVSADEAAATANREKQELAEMVTRTQAEAQQARLERGEAVSTAEGLRVEREQLAAQKAEAEKSAAAALNAKTAAEALLSQARADSEAALAAKAESEQTAAAAIAAKAEAEALMLRARSDSEAARNDSEAARREKEAALLARAESVRAAQSARSEAQRLDGLRARAEDQAKGAARERDEMRQRMQSALSKVVDTQETGRGLILNLPDILFDFGKSGLRSEAREVLSRIAGIMMVTPGYRLAIEGHTDSVGSDEFNLKLSQQRADAVYGYLTESQVNPQIMATTGLGKTHPMASNDSEEGRQKNRRVEIVIQDETRPAE